MFVPVGTDVLFEPCVHRSSLFITCSALYAFLIIVICIAFLTSEVVTDNSPLHYYEVDTEYECSEAGVLEKLSLAGLA